MELIKKYFTLNPLQEKQFQMLPELYAYWNERINVISRKDIDNIEERHILHSMAIAKYVHFNNNAKIMDVGTGGGFPGIPLAIMFPDTEFLLVDSVGKKIKVVNEICHEAGISNVTATQARAEDIKESFDFVVSRAVTEMQVFYNWVSQKIKKQNHHNIPNGILYLKGGQLAEELSKIHAVCRIMKLSDYFQEEFFETKLLVHIHK
jgi:16S rRNA (guanine527-N7)-methyltransferase